MLKWYDKVSRDDEGDYSVIGRVYENGLKVHGETNFSPVSQWAIRSVMKGQNPTFTVEIGVENNPDKNQSSTTIILNNKRDDAYYLGIDLLDRSHLDNEENLVRTVQANSLDIDKIKPYIHGPIDFLFINGWHSINQVEKEFGLYLPYLAKDGYIGLHDTNHHYGPKWLVEVIDRSIWEVRECPGDPESDMGIAFIWRK